MAKKHAYEDPPPRAKETPTLDFATASLDILTVAARDPKIPDWRFALLAYVGVELHRRERRHHAALARIAVTVLPVISALAVLFLPMRP
jgi:hypothetical protein